LSFVSCMEQVGASEKFFLLKRVFMCNTYVNFMSVMAMKNITESCVREKSHIFLDVAWFTLKYEHESQNNICCCCYENFHVYKLLNIL